MNEINIFIILIIMKIYKLGDRIDIKYKLDNLELKDKATITYYHPKGLIFTCGHCFSKNAILDIGDLIYSSGFDTEDEGKEIAIIKKECKINQVPIKTISSEKYKGMNILQGLYLLVMIVVWRFF